MPNIIVMLCCLTLLPKYICAYIYIYLLGWEAIEVSLGLLIVSRGADRGMVGVPCVW